MSGYVDIHAHVLPGIDDGPTEVDDSLAMLRAAADSGIATIAATPHVRSDFPDVDVHELAQRCAGLRARVDAEGPHVELVGGAEVALAWAIDASDDELTLASFGQRGHDLLIETPQTTTAGLETLLYTLRVRGFRVTLAHPERSREFQRNPSALEALAEAGILMQINADTLLGDERRSEASALGLRLCVRGMIHAVASDGHRAASWRPVTQLQLAAAAAAAIVGPDRARWMVTDGPAAIIEGRELPEPPRLVVRRKRRLWTRGAR